VSKYGLFQLFKRLLGEIDKVNGDMENISGFVKVLKIKKEEMEMNLRKPIKGKLLKKRHYKVYKWISFRYSTIKALIKLVFGEWTVLKKKGEMFE